MSVTIPGWLVRSGTSLAFKDISESDDEEALKEIAKSLGKIRVMVAKQGVVPTQAIKKLITNAQNNKYENYATVRKEGKIVNVMNKHDDDTVKNLLVLVSSDDDFVIAHIDSNLSLEQLQNAQLSWNKNRNENK